MKAKELFIASLIYLVGVTVAYFIAVRFTGDAATPAQVMGTIASTFVAIYFYQSRSQQTPPVKVKLSVGATLALVCVLQSLLFQHLLKWMTYPDIGIFFGAAGAFIFPLTLWSTFVKTTPTRKK